MPRMSYVCIGMPWSKLSEGPCVGQTWEDNFQPHLQELDFLFSHRCHGVENCYQQNGMLLGLVYLLKWDHVRRGKTKSHCVSNQPSAICPQLCSALPGPQIGGVNMLIYRNRGIEESWLWPVAVSLKHGEFWSLKSVLCVRNLCSPMAAWLMIFQKDHRVVLQCLGQDRIECLLILRCSVFVLLSFMVMISTSTGPVRL